MSGEAFADQIPIGCWPLPAVDFLDRFNQTVAARILEAAATHFDQNDWLVAFADRAEPSRARPRGDGGESAALRGRDADPGRASARPRDAAAGRRSDPARQQGIAQLHRPEFDHRLLATAPGAVFSTPLQKWNRAIASRSIGCGRICRGWCRTSARAAMNAMCGSGRGWRSFARRRLIQWGSPLPRTDNRRCSRPIRTT